MPEDQQPIYHVSITPTVNGTPQQLMALRLAADSRWPHKKKLKRRQERALAYVTSGWVNRLTPLFAPGTLGVEGPSFWIVSPLRRLALSFLFSSRALCYINFCVHDVLAKPGGGIYDISHLMS